jgi:hypothetical protein
MPKSHDRRKRLAEFSCRFNGNQLVSYIVHLNQPRAYGSVFKVQSDCLKNVGSQFFPRLALGEDCVTSARAQKPPSSASRISKINSMLLEYLERDRCYTT